MRKLRAGLPDYKFDRKYNRFFFGFKAPYGSITLYRSGRGICMGTTTEEDTRIIIRRLARRLQKLGNKIRYNGFTINNIAATLTLGHEIDLPTFSRNVPDSIRYNPESFAGAIYKHGNVTFTLFRNGKVNATGIKSFQEVIDANKEITTLLDLYKSGSDSLSLIKELLDLDF